MPHLGGGLESHYQRGRAEQLARFYDRVIEETRAADAIVILGPGPARVELLRKLSEQPDVMPQIVSCKHRGHLTDDSLVAAVRAALEQTGPHVAISEDSI